jgi:hypothetical protein
MNAHPLVCSSIHFFITSFMPHLGHLPGLSEITSGCITQAYRAGVGTRLADAPAVMA